MGCTILVTVAVLLAPVNCKKINVLLLIADDMRPQLGCYQGPDFPSSVHPKMYTPHLDSLASHCLLLKRAYVQQALCSPSRTSLLTGRRPDTTHVYDLIHYFRHVGGNFTTLPQYFKENGYTTKGIGKVFHPGVASGGDDPISWTEPYFHAPNMEYWQHRNSSWEAVTSAARAQRELPDVQLAEHALDSLDSFSRDFKQNAKPFFLAVGFHKPHLPFVFPEEFLQYYPEKQISLPSNGHVPVNMPEIAWFDYKGLRHFHDIANLNVSGQYNTTLPDTTVKRLRRAYYSALSFTDSLVGALIDRVKELGLWDESIISFWGDHGWQLGEHAEWCKQTNFELATHAPMIVRVPGLTDNGVVTEELTEFVDLFPTLVDAAGLPRLPICPRSSENVSLCTEGMSLMPLLRDGHVTWKQRVFSQYPRNGTEIMGYTMRTSKFRYTEWVRFIGAPQYKPLWRALHGVELYDHVTDPGENYNAADDPKYSEVRKELSEALHAGWRAASLH